MIAIVGGGIGGLTTALSFEKMGLDYHLFEKAPALAEVGAGIWLAPNALQVFDWLGFLTEIQSLGNNIHGMSLGDLHLNPFSTATPDKVIEEFGYTTVAIHRAKLQKLLFSKIPSEKISLGKALKSYEKLSDNSLKINFEDGSSFDCNTLIGADGIHSKVRKQLFPESKTRYSGQTCWRGVASLKLDPQFRNEAFEMWGKGVRFGFSRLSEGKVYWFAVAKSKANEKDKIDKLHSKLNEMYADFHPLVIELIKHTEQDKILRNDIIDLAPMKQWHDGNICLIGDAGHSTTPNMGQGGAQAIEDAYYLANFMTKTDSNKSPFVNFQKARYKKVNQIVNRSWMIGKIGHWSSFTGLRNFIFRSTPNSVMEKQLMQLYQIEKF